MNWKRLSIVRLVTFISVFFYSNTIDAYDFQADGLYYGIKKGTNEAYVAFVYKPNYSGDITIPETVKDFEGNVYTVVGIEGSAFASTSISSIKLPNTLKYIGNNAFTYCSKLMSIQLPSNLDSIGGSFISNSAITHIKIPNSVKHIANSALARSQLESVDLSELSSSITEIPEKMFLGSNLKSIEIPNSIKTIGKDAFSGCSNLSFASLPNSINKIDEQAFYNCTGLENLNLPDQLSSIGRSAFWSCSSLKSINLPTSLSVIEDYVFCGCGLVNLEIPHTVLSIGKGSFNGCKNLKELYLSNSLVSIGETAFQYCENLTSIILPATLTSIGKDAFRSCRELNEVISEIREPFETYAFNKSSFAGAPANPVLYVPSGTKEKYMNCYGWGSFFNDVIEKVETYSLSITASGNGSATYSSTAIRNNTRSFTVNEESSSTITFTPDDGYRIKSVKVNNSTVSVSNNQYTISSINANTTVSVEFEAIPPTTYTLSVTASGNGSATYGSTAIRNNTRSFTVNEGTFVTITFTPDEGYRIKSLKVNNSTVSVPNNWYNISSVNANTTISVEFEAIPPTTYTLSVTASGNGSATYGSTAIQNNTRSFTVNEGTSATITFTPDDGYRIKTVKVNNSTVSVSNNQYTISSISANTTISVEFEAIPPTTYTLSVTASGNGSATYGSTAIRNNTRSFTVNEGTFATITFSPDDGYRIKSVKVNNSVVSVPNNWYNISSINANTTVSVEFEAIPPTTYTLSVTASGNGSATYGSTAIRNNTRSFTVNEGTFATITFSPDDGYRIKSVNVNNSAVSVSNNRYTISSINANTTVSVEFEAIPPTTYTLSVTASGNGSATYSSTTIRNNTRSFSVNEGTYATITFSPDDGYRIKTVKVNNSAVSASNNQYTISIGANTTLSVEFEAIPPTTYTLSVTASGNGSAIYGSTTIRNNTRSFTVNEGISATITFSPDDGYRIKSVKVNNSTVSVSNNQYTISSISANTTVSVEFEAIPPTTYTLSVTASGNGSATYNSTAIRNSTRSFTVNEGTSATITFTPDDGCWIKSVKVNNSTVSVSNNQYTISSINANTTISVEFERIKPVTYTLNITVLGNGSASYDEKPIRSGLTGSFTVNEGTSATIIFTPDDGYRIKTVKVDNSIVSVSNNQYTISSINANTTVEVEFEAIPVVTYSLSITASGNGSVTYNTSTIRNDSRGYILNEGTSVSISLTPDEGNQVKSFKVNGSTVSVPTNSYYISSITRNTTIEVEFEEIPINSESWYNTYITCINRTESKIVTGSNVQKTVGFEIANSGNRSVYVTKLVARHPDTNATLTTSTDMSLLGELKPDSTKALSISLRVDVSPIYEITYTVDSEEYLYDNTQYLILSIKGNKFGVVKFMEASVGVDLKKFSIKPSDNATIEFVPNNGCVLTKATVKDTDITSNIVGSKYTIANITSSTSVNAVFDGVSGDSRSINGHEYVDLGLPSGKYWSTVNFGAKNPEDAGSYSSVHNLGTVSSEWGEYWISPTKDDMQELLDMCEWNWSELNGKKGFIIKGPNGNTMFLPAAGMHYSTYYSSVGTLAYYCTSTHDDYSRYCVFKGDTSGKEFMLESGLLNQYSVRPISTLRNESVFSVDGLHFSVISDSEKTVSLAKGNYGKVLEVPATVKYPSTEWKIVGIDKDALSECNELAAIIWNPDAVFTESVDNPNLLLYVKSADYAPTTIKNVVVNGVADRITLIDASGKNDYYCPQEFTAKEISYTHNYKMETGLGSARGWETIALPFDVQKVTHESKGEIIPFANRKSGDAKKPFWLMTYGANGWTEANSIKANTPYIISMPNHSDYKSEFRLNGRVTFSAENVTMPTSDNLNTTAYNGKTFIPNYTNQSNKNFYALNVNNDLETYSGSDVEGSIFLIGDMVDRVIHPFEAYMTSVSQTRGYIAIDEDLATSIGDISEISAEESPLNIYNLNGQLIRTVDGQSLDEIQKGLPAGVYIVNGKKIIIR